mgnify:CR=1 FL=1
MEKTQEWLYDNLPKYEAFVILNKLCRDGAKSYSEIRETLFGNAADGEKALDALLVLVSLAAKDGRSERLFQCRETNANVEAESMNL